MTPEEQARLNKLIQEGIKLAKQLGDTAAEASFKNFNGDLKTAELAVDSLRKEWKEFTTDISGARLGFARIVDEIKNMNSGARLARNAFASLTTIAGKLQSHQEGINTLSKKELEALKGKVGDRMNDLMLAGKLAKDEVKRLESIKRRRDLTTLEKRQLAEARAAHANISQEITKGVGFTKQFNAQLDEQIKKQIQIEKALGVAGALMKGINKIPFLKDLQGMPEVLGKVESKIRDINSQREKDYDKTASELRKQGLSQDEINKKIGSAPVPVSKAEALKITLSETKNVIKNSLTDPLVVTGFLMAQMVDALKSADKSTGDLAKEFNLTYDGAANVRNELIQIGNLSGNIALNARSLQESMVAVGKSLGSNAMLNQADLETFTELREMAGYTNEELAGIQKLTLATGGNLKDNTKQFLGTVSALNAQNKLTINEKQLLKEVANTSAAIKLSIGGTTEALAKAAFQTKQFGINLEQADKMAESLLDFESSINNQITAELVTGKSLNLEKARLLALNGNIAEASAEILKQVGGTAEFTKMNRIQQEALAKATGLSREELAKSLVEREALKNIGVKDAEAAKEKFDTLVKQYGYDKAVTMLGDEQYATQLKQQSIQERFTMAVEKLKELFISIAEPILKIVSPFVDLATTILPLVNVALTPITFGIQVIGNGIKYIIDSVKNLIGALTGANSQLTVMQAVIGSIAAAYLAYQGYVIGTNIYLGISAALSKEKALAENASKVAIIAQRVAAAAYLPIQTTLALISGTKTIADVTSAEALTLGLATVAIVGGLAMVIGAMNSAKSSIKDGMIGPDGGLIVSGKKGTYKLDKQDTIVAGTDLNKTKSYNDVKIDPTGGVTASADKGTYQISNPPKTSSSKTETPSIDLSSVIAELKANREELQSIKAEVAKQASKPTIIENKMNGTQFGTATAMATYKTQ